MSIDAFDCLRFARSAPAEVALADPGGPRIPRWLRVVLAASAIVAAAMCVRESNLRAPPWLAPVTLTAAASLAGP
jgi:hypothetical protein